MLAIFTSPIVQHLQILDCSTMWVSDHEFSSEVHVEYNCVISRSYMFSKLPDWHVTSVWSYSRGRIPWFSCDTGKSI